MLINYLLKYISFSVDYISLSAILALSSQPTQGNSKMKLSDILFEHNNKFIIKNSKGGYEVYKNGFTHSTRIATVHYSDDTKSFEKAKYYATLNN